MVDENPGASIKGGASLSPQELRKIMDNEVTRRFDVPPLEAPAEPEDAPATEAPEDPITQHPRWQDGTTTGAFVSAAASERHRVDEYNWWQVSWFLILIYTILIALPLLGLIWTVVSILHRIHQL
jgi:hypothetical protein